MLDTRRVIATPNDLDAEAARANGIADGRTRDSDDRSFRGVSLPPRFSASPFRFPGDEESDDA
jgi:hypothetical protein